MRAASLAFCLVSAPRAASACAVCFGANDNPGVIKAFTWGGVVLLSCTFGLLGALVYSIARMEKSRLAADRALGLRGDA